MDLRLAAFKSAAEFEQLYFRAQTPDAPAAEPAPDEDGGAELKLFSELHLVIFALDVVEGKAHAWLDHIYGKLKQFKHLPANGQPMHMVMLKYEDDGLTKLDVLHPHLDDLVYLPLDRLVFLQKMQIFLNLPKRVSPSFLFNQEVRHDIEISKIVKLERLSDVGLAIRNPVPLRRGLPGHFYVNLPGEKTRLEVFGKVLRSEPHPEHPGQFIIYFSYFGLGKEGLQTVRRSLSKSTHYKSLLSDDRARFSFDSNQLYVDEMDTKVFNLMVIDADEASAEHVSQVALKEMDRLNVIRESSYQIFLHRYLNANGGDTNGTPPRPTDGKDFFAPVVAITIGERDLKCLSVDPGPKDGDLFLGHSATDVFSNPDRWMDLLQEPESRLIMEEAASLAGRGKTLDKLVYMQDAQNERAAVNMKIYKGTVDGTVAIMFLPASLADVMKKIESEQRSSTVDGLMLDASFVPQEPSAWINGIRSRAAQVGLVPTPEQFKFWLLSETEHVEPAWLSEPALLGLFIKPVDQRQLMFSLSENLPNKNTLFHFENLGWTSPALNVHVAKEVQLESLSEYGATLKTKQKLVAGTMVYLRSFIYDNAPNGCLAARVYSCEEHPSEKDHFQIFTTYFGINDQFLKFARTWIRENYAQQKAKEG